MAVKILIFGLSVSSSWGNGHATHMRGLCRELGARGHEVIFLERDVPYYAAHRDLFELPGGTLVLYKEWRDVYGRARRWLSDADVAVITSYCADALSACDVVLESRARLRVFYDLDTPVTLQSLHDGGVCSYLPRNGLGDFDLVLSYTGGCALDRLEKQLGARRVNALYGSVDPSIHRPVPAMDEYRSDLSHLGTYAEDRRSALAALMVEPAMRLPAKRFLIGGPQYPSLFPWQPNIYYRSHVAQIEHPVFYCSSKFTLNVTRQAMARMGYCPSNRLFEAAACGVPTISDAWEGLDQFFAPGSEVIVAGSAEDVVGALTIDEAEHARIAKRARERVLSEHTSAHRAIQIEAALAAAMSPAHVGYNQ